MSDYKNLYIDFKEIILNEGNRDQVIFICGKTRHSVKLATQFAKKENFTKRDIYLANVFIGLKEWLKTPDFSRANSLC